MPPMLETALSFDQIKPLPENRVGLAVLGDPISHSLSPSLHNSALAELSSRKPEFNHWHYDKVQVPSAKLEDALPQFWQCGYQGLNLTIPHKVEVLPFLSSVDSDAEIMGAVNTLIKKKQGWHGCNTDGYGLEEGLREDLGVEIKGSEILLLGAGGAARAAAARCLQSECSRLWLGNRSLERLTEVVEILSTSFESHRICSFPLKDIPKQIFTVENLIVINATSLGLRETDPCPIDLINFHPSSKIYDMIYNPPVTKLLHAAKQLDLTQANGLSMLVHQAAHALELWTQEEISVAAMYQGVAENH